MSMTLQQLVAAAQAWARKVDAGCLPNAVNIHVAGGFEAWVNAGQPAVKDTTNFGG